MFFTVWVNKILQKIYKVALRGSLLLFLVSCNYFNKELIAEINGYKLYESDFEEYALALSLPVNDENIRESFIEEWINQTLINIELQYVNSQKFYENKIRNRSSLASLNLFELENEYINSTIDSTISEEEIITYYQNNRDNYIQNSFIVKALYIKIPDSIPEVEQLKNALLLKKDKDRAIIEKYANIYGTNFYWEESKWIYFEDLVRDIPISEDVKEQLVINRNHLIFTDNNYTYLLNIFDYKQKKTNSPLEFEREKIKKHILKRRINEIRENSKELILKNIHEKHTVKRYN